MLKYLADVFGLEARKVDSGSFWKFLGDRSKRKQKHDPATFLSSMIASRGDSGSFPNKRMLKIFTLQTSRGKPIPGTMMSAE